MKYCNKFSPLALGIILCLCQVAGGGQAVFAASGPAPTSSAPHGDVLRATLDNGLRVVIVRDALAPLVTTQITYLAGGYDVPTGFPGTAHAMEHMMFRDSKGMSGAQLDTILGKTGSVFNAFTTSDATQFFIEAPAQYLDVLLHVEATRMRGAEVTEKGWDVEKGAIEQEVSRDISDPGFLADQKAQRALYAGTGYAQEGLGTRPSFDKTTAADLKEFYHQWYMPNNAVLVIAGDVDTGAAMAMVKRLFGSIPRGALPAHAVVNLEPFKPQTITQRTPDAAGTVQYLYRMPGMRSKDYAAFEVLLDALQNARSPLSDLAAQGKVLSARVQPNPFAKGGMVTIEAQFPKGTDGKIAAGKLDNVIAKLLQGGVPEDLVEAAKLQEGANFEFNKNAVGDVASSWSQALAWQGLDSPDEALHRILAVTPREVDQIAREYLKREQRVTVVLTPSENGKRPPSSHGFGGVESLAGNDKVHASLPEWAVQPFAKVEIPHWTLSPVRMTLANGITLIVQPESISKSVTVLGRVDQDPQIQEPKGQDGVGTLVEQLFDYGTTTRDRADFHKALDAIAATESGGTTFRLLVPSSNLDRGMQLLASNELAPALPQAAFEIQQRSLSHTLAGQVQTPRYKDRRAVQEHLLPFGDAALRQATSGTVDKLTLADAKQYFAQTYRPDMTTIVVVGDVTPAQARVVVEKYFGSWKATGPKPNVLRESVPLNTASFTVVPNAYASQDSVVLGQVLPTIDLHSPDRYALQLGNAVLGGSAFASRLLQDIRVRHGYAYSASSELELDRTRALLLVSFATDPRKVVDATKLVHQNLVEMQNTPLTIDELVNARQVLISQIPFRLSRVSLIAGSLLQWSYTGQPLDESIVAARHYLVLTPAQIQAAFKKYVRPDHLVEVVEGPAPNQN